VILITHNKAVEEFVHHQAQQADSDVANRIDEVKIVYYISPRFGKCTMVAHHTHSQNDTIQNLTFITMSEKHKNTAREQTAI